MRSSPSALQTSSLAETPVASSPPPTPGFPTPGFPTPRTPTSGTPTRDAPTDPLTQASVPLGPRRQLRRVLSFATPQRGLLVLSMLLMAVQAAASQSRMLLLYPIMTRVFSVAESSKLEVATASGGVVAPGTPSLGASGPPTAGPAAAPTASDESFFLKYAERRGSGFLKAFNAVIDGMNAMTAPTVPDAWLEHVTKGKMTPEQRAEAQATQREKYATLASVAILFLAFLIVMSVTAFFEDYVNEIVRLRILMDVRRKLCAKLLHQPMTFYDRARRGDVVQRVMDDVGGFSSGLKLIYGSLPEGLLSLIFGVVVLAGLSLTMTAICLPGLLLFIPLRLFAKRVKKQAKKRQDGSAKRVEVLLQIVSGIRTVKAFRSEDRKVAEFAAADDEVYRRSVKVQRTKSFSDAVTEFLNNFLVMALAIGGSWLVLRGVLGIGPAALLMFLTQVGNLYKPAKKLVKDLNGMNEAMASVDRVFDVLDLPPPPEDPPGAVPFEGFVDAVRFEHVGFEYRSGQPVLEDITFEIPRGATVALVGPSGSGKSTLCDLLLRFYDPTEGRITVDGRALGTLQRDSYVDRTAVVTQDPFLFHTSIGENIRQGRPGASDAEVEAAARAAFIHEHVASLPAGDASEVGARGARHSGGQRQRITIARAIIRDPLLLVLDEATASLDAESERAVQEALDHLREGRTTLVVAHRLSTVRRADRIVVLDRGRIQDQGTHEELLARGGLYARLCAMQNLGSPPGPEREVVDDAPAPAVS